MTHMLPQFTIDVQPNLDGVLANGDSPVQDSDDDDISLTDSSVVPHDYALEQLTNCEKFAKFMTPQYNKMGCDLDTKAEWYPAFVDAWAGGPIRIDGVGNRVPLWRGNFELDTGRPKPLLRGLLYAPFVLLMLITAIMAITIFRPMLLVSCSFMMVYTTVALVRHRWPFETQALTVRWYEMERCMEYLIGAVMMWPQAVQLIQSQQHFAIGVSLFACSFAFAALCVALHLRYDVTFTLDDTRHVAVASTAQWTCLCFLTFANEFSMQTTALLIVMELLLVFNLILCLTCASVYVMRRLPRDMVDITDVRSTIHSVACLFAVAVAYTLSN